MIRIWFNHWFSTAYNIINLIKNEISDCLVIGTNENDKSVISAVCDEWYKEPILKGNEYVDYCLKFCCEHQIDVFMPRRELLSVSSRKNEFEQLGVKVMVDEYDVIDLLNHKDKAYNFLKSKSINSIPEHYIVRNVEEFKNAYYNLLKNYKEVCFKFVHDEGGKSFRLIDNNRKGYLALFKKQNTRMLYDDVISALSERETFAPMMVMPNLPGEEISVDCLKTNKGTIMIPRVKDNSRIERIEFDENILNKTKEIIELVNLEWPCNVQFKYLDGVPYFLEINTRMSGGVHMACLATGVNIPAIAVKKLLGKDYEWDLNKEEKYVTHVEYPVVL